MLQPVINNSSQSPSTCLGWHLCTGRRVWLMLPQVRRKVGSYYIMSLVFSDFQCESLVYLSTDYSLGHRIWRVASERLICPFQLASGPVCTVSHLPTSSWPGHPSVLSACMSLSLWHNLCFGPWQACWRLPWGRHHTRSKGIRESWTTGPLPDHVTHDPGIGARDR